MPGVCLGRCGRPGGTRRGTCNCQTCEAADAVGQRGPLEQDPEKWAPVFPRDKREAFARRSCSNKKIERNDESKRSHHALSARRSKRNIQLILHVVQLLI